MAPIPETVVIWTVNTAEVFQEAPGKPYLPVSQLGYTQAKASTSAWHQPSEAEPLQPLKLHLFDNWAKIWTIFSPTAAALKLTHIFTGHYLHQYTSWTWSSINSPLTNTLLTCKEFLSLLPTGSTFCSEEPLKKSVSNTDYANTIHSFHLGYKLGSISAVWSSHHSFHLSLPFSSSSGLVLSLQRPHTCKVSQKNLLHIQYFHRSFTSQQEKASAFITSAHVEHQFLGFEF